MTLLAAGVPTKRDTELSDRSTCGLLKSMCEEDIENLLFMDASHFVIGCDFLGYIYGKVRRFILTFSRQRRYNVFGAFDLIPLFTN